MCKKHASLYLHPVSYGIGTSFGRLQHWIENNGLCKKLYFRYKTMARCPQVLNIIPNQHDSVYGVATLGDELFVIRFESLSVDVYRASDFVESRQIPVPGMKRPCSLAACPHNNCLYIGDNNLKLIHRVDRPSSSVTKWSVGEHLCGFSLTKYHHVLVTLPSSKRIREYTTHGDVMREINLDVSIDNPQHSIELSSGQFVVCHWGRTQHRVCTVDTSGRIVQSYGGPKGSSAGQLNGPRCLAVDKRGYVLVTDWGNNKVQILSPALTHLCDVTISEHKLFHPYRLHVDEQRGRLYLGEDSGRGRRVFVLAMQ